MYQFDEEMIIEDELLRDGLQNEKRIFSLDEKLDIVERLVTAGVRRIQIGSFVHPKWVPQMAETDELCKRLPTHEGVTFTGLVLNQTGLLRAIDAGLEHLSISISASKTHSLKNANKSPQQALKDILPAIERASKAGIVVRGGIQSALGCGFEGQIQPQIVRQIAVHMVEAGAKELNLADTAGLANPTSTFEMCRLISEAVGDDVKLSLHLHDTRGMALANALAGLQAGVRIFDAAVAGVGGCPFVPNATGNVATEDLAYMGEQMGLTTHIDITKLRELYFLLEKLLGRALPGRMCKVPTPLEYLQKGHAHVA